jgi:hypothetical protein|tara:strand:+ start:225 stop:800 length:576 start_codon:yes stop_codon:yes gene_type:complete
MRNMKAETRLRAPIPGQSLTDEPRGYAWERPSEYSTPEEALQFYLPRITAKETLEDIMLALDNGFPLATLVKGIYMNGVMEGKHSIDIGLLIAPVLHEIILSAAKTYGVAVKELPVSPREQEKRRSDKIVETAVKRQLERGLREDESLEESMVSTDEGAENVPQEQEEMPEMAETEEKPEPEAKGLMSRRT